MGQLGLGHLEREQRDRLAVVDGCVLGDVGGKGRLAHRRPRRQHDQVAVLEAAGEIVDVGEARRRAGEADVLARQLLELVDLLVEDGLDGAHLGHAALVADRNSAASARSISSRGSPRWASTSAWIWRVVSRMPAHAARRRGRCARSRDGAHRGHDRRQRVDVGLAAGLVEDALAAQVVADGEGVDRLGVRLLLEAEHRLEDALVARAVEVVGLQPDLEQHAVERLLGEQDRAEHGGLGLLVVGRDAARGLRRDGDCHAGRVRPAV